MITRDIPRKRSVRVNPRTSISRRTRTIGLKVERHGDTSGRSISKRYARYRKGPAIARDRAPVFPRISTSQYIVPAFTPNAFLKAYIRSENFRRILDSGKYIYADGYCILRSRECIQIRNNRIVPRMTAMNHPEQYCVHVIETTDMTYRVLNRNGMRDSKNGFRRDPLSYEKLSRLRDAEKINDIIIDTFKRLYNDDGIPPITFPEALKYYMSKNHLTNAALAEILDSTPETISKYRSGMMVPKLPVVIAMCVVFSLDLYYGELFVNLAGYYLNNTPVCRLYKQILGLSLYFSLKSVNKSLVECGQKPLTGVYYR